MAFPVSAHRHLSLVNDLVHVIYVGDTGAQPQLEGRSADHYHLSFPVAKRALVTSPILAPSGEMQMDHRIETDRFGIDVLLHKGSPEVDERGNPVGLTGVTLEALIALCAHRALDMDHTEVHRLLVEALDAMRPQDG